MTRQRIVRRNGETNPATYLVLIAVAAVGFYVFHVAPVYMDNLEAKEAVGQAFNTYWMEGEKNARQNLMVRLNLKGVGTHLEVNEDGVESWKPGLGVDPDNVIIEETDGSLTVRISYTRTIEFSPLKKRKTFHLVAEKVGKKLK